jgi:hypothetical protein
VSGDSVPALTLGTDGKLPGYVLKTEIESKREPASKGAVFVLPTPVAVKAGAVIGHVGKMQNHDDPQPRNLLHLEVFTCEDFPAFVAKSKEAAKALPAEQKTLVEIHASTKVIPHQAGFTKDNPPLISMAGEVTGYNQIIPLSVLESLPAENKIKIETPQQGGSPTVVNWWHLEGVLGGTNNQVLNGWVREQELISTRHNPWEWAGFAFLEETSTNLQNWASYLHDQNSLTDVEKSVYKPAPTGPVKDRLYDIIDADKNDKLTVAEIVGALGKPWHAQSISQLVVKYESEWLYKADKWSSLDQYMGSPNPSWDAEKARIEKLAWWGDLAGKYGVSVDGLAWHIHSIALTQNNKHDMVGRFTLEILRAADPVGLESYHQEILPYLNKYALAYGLERPRAIAHFISQIAHESGLKVVEESLSFPATNMKRTYGCKTHNHVNG